MFVALRATPVSAGFVPVFWEDFDGSGAVNTYDWGFETGFVRNEELQLYTTSTKNARRSDGKLIIEARKETVDNPAYDPDAEPGEWKKLRQKAYYTSASLYSTAAWTYGRYAIRAKIPEGSGMWPAIWMLGINESSVGWPACGEIDIMENVGYEPYRVHNTVHTAGGSFGKWTDFGDGSDDEPLSAAYHVYLIDWSPRRINFMVDYNIVYTYENGGRPIDEWPFDNPFKMLLNVAVGGTWGGNRGISATFPQRMYVDYVRVYKWVD